MHINKTFNKQQLPMLIENTEVLSEASFIEHQEMIKTLAYKELNHYGALLFRGFSKGNHSHVSAFAKLFTDQLLSYDFASTPRSKVESGVYTTTEYPAHQSIPLHNEQSYTLNWPDILWFHCVNPGESGGETPIVDSRKVYESIPTDIRQRFIEKKLLYVRNYGNGLDLPWQQVFNTDDSQYVESYCQQNSIEYKWKNDGNLRTRQLCQAVLQHPSTEQWTWFNQAHLFHISNLAPDTREVLLDVVDKEDLPRNVYYGDGSEIENSILDTIRAVINEHSTQFSWQAGDILMLDNILVAHGRNPFKGNRKVVVAMANLN